MACMLTESATRNVDLASGRSKGVSAKCFSSPKLPLKMPAHMNIQFQHHDTKTDTKLQLPRGCCSIPELRLFEAPSYTLHAPAIIRVVGCAATCECIVCGHLSTSKGIKVHVNIVAQDLLAKYHATYASNT